ncbi:MAG: MATE family efflux transporter [Novosphingobium sp.]
MVIIYAGVAAAMLFNVLSNVVRALGDSRTPLYFLIWASILNILLDLVLILHFNMGVAGAAVATVLSQAVSGLLCIFYIVKKFPMLHVRLSDFRALRGRELWQHVRLGLPMGFQASIIGIGVIILQYVLNGQGALTVAAFTAAQKIEQFTCQPFSSFGMTMATFAAQNYGAGLRERIKQGVHGCAAMSLGYGAAIMALNILAGGMLARFFVGNAPAEITAAHQYLNITSLFYPTLSLLFIFRFTLQGLGQGVAPTIAGIMELTMRALGVLLLAGPLGFSGICVAYALAWPGSMTPLLISYLFTMRSLVGARGGTPHPPGGGPVKPAAIPAGTGGRRTIRARYGRIFHSYKQKSGTDHS